MRRLVSTLLIWLSGVLSAQDFGAKTQVSLLVEPATAKAGDTIDVALHLKMPDGWHTYWRNPGENGMPTTVKWILPEGITAGAIRWPVPEKVEWLGMFTYAYHHEAPIAEWVMAVAVALDHELIQSDRPFRKG